MNRNDVLIYRRPDGLTSDEWAKIRAAMMIRWRIECGQTARVHKAEAVTR